MNYGSITFQHHVEVVNDRIIVRLEGSLPPGSAGNHHIATVVTELREALRRSPTTEVVIDCAALDYQFGDALGTLWLVPMSQGLKCQVIATGATKVAIESLSKISRAVPIAEPR